MLTALFSYYGGVVGDGARTISPAPQTEPQKKSQIHFLSCHIVSL